MLWSVKSFHQNVLDVLLTLVALAVFGPVLTSMLALIAPFYLLRHLIIVLVHLVCGNDFPMGALDSIHMHHKTSTSATGMNALFWQGSQKGPRTQEYLKMMRKNFVQAKTSEGEDYVPQVWSYPVNYLGYYFWKNEHQGDMDEHIAEYPEVAQDEEHLRCIFQKLQNESFPEGRSPWMGIAINLKTGGSTSWDGSVTCLVFRTHHCLGDGMSLRKLFITRVARPMAQDFVDVYEKAFKKFNWSSHILDFVIGVLSVPRHFFAQFLIQDKNSLHGPRLTGELITHFSQQLDLQIIMDIKDKMNITVNYIFIAAVAGALRRIFLEREGKLPSEVHAVFPLILKPRTDKDIYCNNFSVTSSELCIHEAKAMDRLAMTQKILDKLAKSALPHFSQFLVHAFLGNLPSFLARLVTNKPFATIGIANFLMPNCPLESAEGFICKDIVNFSTVQGRQAIGVSIMSFNGHYRISAVVDKVAMDTEEEVASFVQYVEEEIRTLHEEITQEMFEIV